MDPGAVPGSSTIYDNAFNYKALIIKSGAETGSTRVVKVELAFGMVSAVIGPYFIVANDNYVVANDNNREVAIAIAA